MMNGNPSDLKYILAILNSKLGKHLVKLYVTQLQKRQFRMLRQYVDNFPIPKINNDKKYRIVELVDLILNSKTDNTTLDAYIYKLYNLSKEEIEFIEFQ